MGAVQGSSRPHAGMIAVSEAAVASLVSSPRVSMRKSGIGLGLAVVPECALTCLQQCGRGWGGVNR